MATSDITTIPALSVHIYVLVDPRNRTIFYVGQSVDPAKRLKAHISEGRRVIRASKTNRWRYLHSMIAEGVTPTIQIVDTVPLDFGLVAERNWYDLLTEIGCKLTNQNCPVFTEAEREMYSNHYGKHGAGKCAKSRIWGG